MHVVKFVYSRSRSKSRSKSRSPSRSRSRSPRSERSSHNRYGEVAPPSRILGIFGLSGSTREQDLEDLFSPYGRLESVKLIVDRQTGESKRFGFVYYEELDDASRAQKELNGTDLHSKQVRIDFSLTKGAHSPTPGKYLGKISNYERSGRGRYGGRDRDRDRGYYDGGRYDSRPSYGRYDDHRYSSRDYGRYDDRRGYDDRRYDDRRY